MMTYYYSPQPHPLTTLRNRPWQLLTTTKTSYSLYFDIDYQSSLTTSFFANMPHATATINGITVAETDTYEVVDGNIYFPPSSLTKSAFTPTSTKTHCPYKGKKVFA